MTSPNLPFFFLFDVREALPAKWEAQVLEAVQHHSTGAILEGGAPTSLEAPGTQIELDLLDGDAVRARLPWLFGLYAGHFLDLARRATGLDVMPDPVDQSAVNVNALPPNGGGYELHVDSNPVTGLLFLTTHGYEEGGILEMENSPGHWLRLAPLAGTLAIFNAQETPHRVTAASSMRISAPMNYFLGEHGRIRPAGLDDRLYESKSGDQRE